MTRSTSPGRNRPGLLIILILLLAVAGCAVKTRTITYTPKPTASAPRHVAPEPEQTATPEQREPEAVTNKEREPDTAPVQQKDQSEAPKSETTSSEPANVSATPTVVEPSVEVKPSSGLTELRREFMQAPAGSKEVALTFDAGASPKPTPALLATLKRYGLHCTFFLTGKWMEANPELTRRIVEDGHEIGNHSYSHPDFRKLGDDQIKEQLEHTEQIALDTAGVSTKPLFRPPYGGRDKRVKGVLAEAGYRSIYWSVDSWDSYKKGITAAEIRQRVLAKVKGGDIVLMHCGSAPTAEALPSIIEELQAGGYRLVKVSQLL